MTGAGTITAWRDLRLNLTQGTFDATAASATFDQKSLGRKNATGTLSIWLGTEGVPPALGDTISVISVSVGADEVTPTTIDDATVYGTYKVTGVNYSFQDSPATAEISFESGFIV